MNIGWREWRCSAGSVPQGALGWGPEGGQLFCWNVLATFHLFNNRGNTFTLRNPYGNDTYPQPVRLAVCVRVRVRVRVTVTVSVCVWACVRERENCVRGAVYTVCIQITTEPETRWVKSENMGADIWNALLSRLQFLSVVAIRACSNNAIWACSVFTTFS